MEQQEVTDTSCFTDNSSSRFLQNQRKKNQVDLMAARAVRGCDNPPTAEAIFNHDDCDNVFQNKVDTIKDEGRYRIFAELFRLRDFRYDEKCVLFLRPKH